MRLQPCFALSTDIGSFQKATLVKYYTSYFKATNIIALYEHQTAMGSMTARCLSIDFLLCVVGCGIFRSTQSEEKLLFFWPSASDNSVSLNNIFLERLESVMSLGH